MKTDIHPTYKALQVSCSCGQSFETHSTYDKDSLNIEACNKCHPAYTGKQNQNTAAGDRVNKFMKRFARGKKA